MDFNIVTQLSNDQLFQLERLFQLEWWTKGRELSDIKRMVEHSDFIVGYIDPETDELIAFARVLTDYVYKAMIFDVIVKEAYRGRELGCAIINTILIEHSLKDVKHFELYCRPEMVPFYHKWGFSEKLGDLTFMRLINK
ncbi:GNAT family N-acetyltransferase [Neobacillus sp. NRS-1170]|uniref:GNAT family N-acetyltransferase n=1 Tax=Neobacillus sp. NRS-1170 TaxID=3233898 RepID=UPI003D2A45E6